jgi:hypothetical protein
LVHGPDLPPDAEEFRTEIRAWLEENLPDGWFDEGFSMTADEKAAWNEEWTQKLFEGGWICATWPEEYGGKGLTTMQGVVLAEEFARAKAPMRADFFGDTLVGPTILMNGTEEQKKVLPAEDPRRVDALVPGLLRAGLRFRPGVAQDDRGARRRRVGHQRSEGVDHPGPVRRLLLRAGPHRPEREEAGGHLVPAGAR